MRVVEANAQPGARTVRDPDRIPRLQSERPDVRRLCRIQRNDLIDGTPANPPTKQTKTLMLLVRAHGSICARPNGCRQRQRAATAGLTRTGESGHVRHMMKSARA